MKLYSIKDELSEFAYPIPLISDEAAQRYLRQQVNTNEFIANSPEDFSIWSIGDFDEKTGIITGHDPKLIIRAAAIKGGKNEQ